MEMINVSSERSRFMGRHHRAGVVPGGHRFCCLSRLTVGDAAVPTSGYVAMALGVIFSLVVGFGLMALIFYSSRKGYGEPAVLITEPRPDRDDAPRTPDAT
jgi:hypothetical protein